MLGGMLCGFWELKMADCAMKAKPLTGWGPGGPTGWPTMLGPMRPMSLRDDGREPIWGCGVWPRGPLATKTPLGMGGEAEGVWCLMRGNGGGWAWKWGRRSSMPGGVPFSSSSSSPSPFLKSAGPLCSFACPC